MGETKRRRRPKPLTDEQGEVRELTRADFRKLKPVREAMPELIEAVENTRRKGRPKAEAPKAPIGFRLAADLVARIRATGRGYNARVEKALRDAFMKTEHAPFDASSDLNNKGVDVSSYPEPAAKSAASK